MKVLFLIGIVFAVIAVLLALIAASGLEAEYIQPDGFRIRTSVAALGSGLIAAVAMVAAVLVRQGRRG